MVVQMDALFHRLLHRRPVRLLEALLRAGGHFQKAAVLRIEALQDRLCDQQLQFAAILTPPEKKPAHAGSGWNVFACRIRTAVLPSNRSAR